MERDYKHYYFIIRGEYIKRIGILSFWGVPNYGAWTQAYALNNVVRTLVREECQVVHINYLHPKHDAGYYQKDIRRKNNFAYSYNQILHTKKMSAEELEQEEFDVVITGSDVIWEFSIEMFGDDKHLVGHGLILSVAFQKQVKSCFEIIRNIRGRVLMKKLAVIPLDPIEAYLKTGRSYEYLEKLFNPDSFFDEVYCISPWGENEKKSNINYIKAKIENMGNVIKKIRPNVVRAYGGMSCGDWAIAAKQEGIPVVISVHDTKYDYMHHCLKYADVLAGTSAIVIDKIKEKYEINRQIFLRPNAVDTELFCKKSDKHIFDTLNQKYGNGKHILHVGRKEEQKNLETVILALQYLPNDYSAIFLGNGDPTFYQKLAEKNGVEKRCYFETAVSREQLSYFYSWCDCMCTPSRWEGFGNVFVEAASCESVVITSNIAPMNEYLKANQNAVLVDDYENPESMAKYIKKVCSDDIQIDIIRKEARKVGEMHCPKKIDEKEIEIYKYAMENVKENETYDEICQLREKVKGDKVIIYGAGKNGKALLSRLPRDKVAYFADSNKELKGEKICGIEVIDMEQLKEIWKNYSVVISPKNCLEIEKKLMEEKIDYFELEFFEAIWCTS